MSPHILNLAYGVLLHKRESGATRTTARKEVNADPTCQCSSPEHRNAHRACMSVLVSGRSMHRSPSQFGRQALIRWWGALLLFSVMLCLVASLRYYAIVEFDASAPALLFRVSMLLGHFTVLCAILLSPVLAIALLCQRHRWVIPMGVICASLIVLGVLVDTQLYQLYRFHINAGVMNLLLGGAARATFIFSATMYAQAVAIAAAVVAIVAGMSWFIWRSVGRTAPHARFSRSIAALLVACICSFHIAHMWADVVAYEPILEQTVVLPLRYAATAKRFLRSRGWEINPRPVATLARTSRATPLAYPLHQLECDASAKALNIVFILIDSWRFDEMNARVTPRITAFARDASRFIDHYSGGNATRIGVFSLFYAIPGTYWHQILSERRGPVFIEELQRRNYDIRVFRSTPIYSPEFDRTVFADVRVARRESDGERPVQWDRDLTNDFLGFIDQRGPSAAPFFAFLFYDSPHSFDVPDKPEVEFGPSALHVNYLKLHPRTDPTPLRNRYRTSVHYVDSLIGEVLDGMHARALLESTIVVITSDHGQEFNDSGLNFWGHGSAYSRAQIRIPLVLYDPRRAGEVVSHTTSHFDVVPTLLQEHFGCTTPLDAFSVGRSLFDAAERHPFVLSEYSDFAIVQRDRITVIREQGMQMFAHDYSEIDAPLDAAAARAAIEQKTRFYRAVPLRSHKSGE
jgi:uncharacterized protein